MKIKYENQSLYVTSNNFINIEQPFDPETHEKFKSKESALAWFNKYVKKTLNASFIYFEFSICDDSGNLIDNNEVKTGKIYTLKLKETTGRLTGDYDIALISDNIVASRTFKFIDGEATADIMFNISNHYEIDLDIEFFIGTNKYYTLIDETIEHEIDVEIPFDDELDYATLEDAKHINTLSYNNDLDGCICNKYTINVTK